jgi:penicillin-binding protein-related factor A (putative recombinase)
MNEFENEIGKTFQGYRDARIAHLFFLHPPMRCIGQQGGAPVFVQAGKAGYDVAGFYYDDSGTFIAAELKQTRDHEVSLAITGEGKKGGGIQYHQLVALCEVANAGGMAMLLWNNGGDIGILRSDYLKVALAQYDTSVKVEKNKGQYAKGSRSIQWGLFDPIRIQKIAKAEDTHRVLWLPDSPMKVKAAKKDDAITLLRSLVAK